MKSKAAIAFSAGQPLSIDEVDLEGPKSGEVLVEVMATGVCHTDAYTLSGGDPEGLFPSILGHEVGLKLWKLVIMLYRSTPQSAGNANFVFLVKLIYVERSVKHKVRASCPMAPLDFH